ncbi:MAG: nucleotide exchange factor GrpE, partial [Succinivibrio sp.]
MQTEETNMQKAFEEAAAQAKDFENNQADETLDNSENISECECSSEECQCENDEQSDSVDASEIDVHELVSENEKLKARISELEDKGKADTDKFIRALAEAENQKKRIEADVERERKFGNEKILKALIPVVDSLELALQHSDRNDPAIKNTVEGVENTVKLLLKELSSFGVNAIDPLGQAFDPNLHQAISMAPSADVEANNVMNVMQKGYTLNGRVVRPAMVIVSSGAPAAPATEQKNNINIEA